MRKAAVALALAASIAGAGTSFAQEGDKSVEATFTYGTDAFNGLGGQAGATVGFGYELRHNLLARADLSYLRSSIAMMDTNVTGTRLPLDLGVRYLYPLKKIDRDLTAYGQGAIEISYDDWHPGPGLASTNRASFGIVVGGGAEYLLAPQYGALVNLQYHIVQDSYLTASVGMAYHF